MLLRRMMQENPRLASFVPFIGPGALIDRNKLNSALRHGFAIVRWRVSDPHEAASRGNDQT
jgi:hypothetical protein